MFREENRLKNINKLNSLRLKKKDIHSLNKSEEISSFMKNSSREKYSPWVNKRRMSRDIYEFEENGEGYDLLWLFLRLNKWNKNISNQLSLSLGPPLRMLVCWKLDREPICSVIPRLNHIQQLHPLLPFHQEYPNFSSSSESLDFITCIHSVYILLKLR